MDAGNFIKFLGSVPIRNVTKLRSRVFSDTWDSDRGLSRGFPGDPPDPRTPNQCILKFNISSTMEGLDAALASLRLSKSINYAETAREYKCDETTLRRRH